MTFLRKILVCLFFTSITFRSIPTYLMDRFAWLTYLSFIYDQSYLWKTDKRAYTSKYCFNQLIVIVLESVAIFFCSCTCTNSFEVSLTSTLRAHAIVISNHRTSCLTLKQLYWNYATSEGRRTTFYQSYIVSYIILIVCYGFSILSASGFILDIVLGLEKIFLRTS